MRSRRFLSLAGIAALAAMLFAQAALALAACDAFLVPSQALMIATHDGEHASCHEADQNPNLCLAHCQSSDQTLDKHQVKVPDVFLQPLRLAPAPQASLRPVPAAARLPAPAAGPPLRILFRSFLI